MPNKPYSSPQTSIETGVADLRVADNPGKPDLSDPIFTVAGDSNTYTGADKRSVIGSILAQGRNVVTSVFSRGAASDVDALAR